jgi:hypothetical protein
MFNPELFAASAPFWEDEGVALRFLLHDCPPEVAGAAFRRFRPEPGVLGKEVSPLREWPGAYIVCADDRVATPSWARRAACGSGCGSSQSRSLAVIAPCSPGLGSWPKRSNGVGESKRFVDGLEQPRAELLGMSREEDPRHEDGRGNDHAGEDPTGRGDDVALHRENLHVDGRTNQLTGVSGEHARGGYSTLLLSAPLFR